MAQFTEITGSSPELATQYLQLTDSNIEQAMQLYFENGGAPLTEEPTTQPPDPQPAPHRSGFEDESGVVHVDSDSEDELAAATRTQPSAIFGAGSTLDDDAAMARRLQEEMYGTAPEGEVEDGVRAPMARTTETLVGPGMDFDEDDMHANILSQLRTRQRGGSFGASFLCQQRLTDIMAPRATGHLQSARRPIDLDGRFRGDTS